MQPGGERWRVIDSRVYLERTTTSKHTSATRFATKRSIVVSTFYRLPRSTCVHGVSPRRRIEIFIAAIVSPTPLSSRTWNFIPNPFDCSLLLPTPLSLPCSKQSPWKETGQNQQSYILLLRDLREKWIDRSLLERREKSLHDSGQFSFRATISGINARVIGWKDNIFLHAWI